MSKYIKKTIIGLGFLSALFMVACDDIDPLVESIDYNRAFSPIGVTPTLKNIVELNLSWTAVKGVNGYVVEIYGDSLQYDPANLVKRAEVETNKYIETLLGDSRYSVRVMAKGENVSESKWSGVTFVTEVQSIFLPQQVGDVSSTYAILKWPAGETATKVTLTPIKGTSSVVTKQISAADVAAGIIKVDGLTPNVAYTAILYSGTRRIGKATVETLPEGAIVVTPTDDLLSMLSAAKDGDSFYLSPGEYLKDGGKIAISKNITIRGFSEGEKPVLHGQLIIAQVNSLLLKYLILDGSSSKATLLDHAMQFTTAGACGTITVDACEIKNYNKSLVSSGSIALTIESIVINNSIVSNIKTNAADCIDIRSGFLKSLKLTNSTFNNCASARDFIRLDDASGTYPSRVSEVLIDQCTLYKVANKNTNRILYVRFKTNTLTVSNTIIAETAGYYTNQANSAQPECSKNNYYNAPGFLAASAINVTAKYDISGTQTTLDPGFADAANGNFKLSNETLITKKIGDPRWW